MSAFPAHGCVLCLYTEMKFLLLLGTRIPQVHSGTLSNIWLRNDLLCLFPRTRYTQLCFNFSIAVSRLSLIPIRPAFPLSFIAKLDGVSTLQFLLMGRGRTGCAIQWPTLAEGAETLRNTCHLESSWTCSKGCIPAAPSEGSCLSSALQPQSPPPAEGAGAQPSRRIRNGARGGPGS